MKNPSFAFAIGFLLLASCSSKPGTLRGGALGVGTEPLVTENCAPLTKGPIGIAAKTPIKASISAEDREVLEQRAPLTLQKLDNREKLYLQDIKNMTKNGISNGVIIQQICATNSVFILSSQQIDDLNASGVSTDVINYMLKTGE